MFTTKLSSTLLCRLKHATNYHFVHFARVIFKNARGFIKGIIWYKFIGGHIEHFLAKKYMQPMRVKNVWRLRCDITTKSSN